MTDPADEAYRSVDAAIARALSSYEDLVAIGEEIEDEWSYVHDLESAWRARLEEVAAARSGARVEPAAAAALERVADEIARIRDPHRAIDWLSTYPQVVLLALGEEP
jgi:hypothetical protein